MLRFIKPRRKTLGFSHRDTRRVPFGLVGNGVCSRFRFLAAEKEDFPMSLIKRAYRYRCYPTAEQRQVLARTFGCCRWVYNQALARKTDGLPRSGATALLRRPLGAPPAVENAGGDGLARRGVLGAAPAKLAPSGSRLCQLL